MMRNNRWDLYAVACLTSIFVIIQNNYGFMFIFFLWLMYLVILQRISLLTSIISTFVCLFFIVYLPPVVESEEIVDEAERESSEQLITGTISGEVVETSHVIQFPFRNHHQTEQLLVVYFKTDSEILHVSNNIFHGSKCSMKGRRQLPDIATNPHQFNYRQYLQKQNIQYQFIIDASHHIHCEDSPIRSKMSHFRIKWVNHIAKIYDKEMTAWISALVLVLMMKFIQKQSNCIDAGDYHIY